MNAKDKFIAIFPTNFFILLIIFFLKNPNLIERYIYIISVGMLMYYGIINYRASRMFQLALPIVGIPDKDKISILALLCNIRCLEVKHVYHTIKNYQQFAVDDNENWIKLFLKNHLFPEYIYDDNRTKKEETQQAIISELYQEKFQGNHFDGNFDGEEILIAALYCNNVETLTQLKSCASLNMFSNTISFLITEYEYFYNLGSKTSFLGSTFSNYFLRPKILLSYETINLMWNEIIQALRAALAHSKQKNGCLLPEESKLLIQIDALTELVDKLNYVIKKENAKSYFPNYLDPKKEKIILELESNDLTYDPYK